MSFEWDGPGTLPRAGGRIVPASRAGWEPDGSGGWWFDVPLGESPLVCAVAVNPGGETGFAMLTRPGEDRDLEVVAGRAVPVDVRGDTRDERLLDLLFGHPDQAWRDLADGSELWALMREWGALRLG